MPTLSIIVPVFNSSDYIDRFFVSLKNQTFTDFEVIFVYDLSNDDSLSKIQFFSSKENELFNIKIIINESKKGVGFARELGLAHTNPNSKYVIFLDCDDSFTDDYFEKMVEKIDTTDSDLACCGFSRINEQTNSLMCEEMIHNPDSITIDENLGFPFFLINVAVWNKIFKKDLVAKGSFGSIKHGEDLFFLLTILPYLNKVSFINESLYSYYIHSNSLINSLNIEKFEDTICQLIRFRDLQDQNLLFNLASAFIFVRIGIGATLRVFMNNKKDGHKAIKLCKKYMSKNFDIFKHNDFLSFSFLAKCGKKGLSIWILKVLYFFNAFSLAASFYVKKIANKKEIRW